MRASAKGVLLMPEDCLPDGVSMEDIAESWAEFNGVIVYKPSPSRQIPQQVANNSTNIGITELLNLQLKFFEDISGVNGALQGKRAARKARLFRTECIHVQPAGAELYHVFA